MLSPTLRFVRRGWDLGLVLVLAVLAVTQVYFQLQHRAYLRDITHAVLAKAHATTEKAKALAIRDYLRKNVAFHGAETENRPFLRATAAETLASGKGYCGEVSRTFICMARVAGLHAQRINLYGPKPHVVAEVDLPSGAYIVDCQNPPHIPELERLDRVLLMYDYDDYSTLNVRRLGISWLFSRVKMQMGPITFWGENPHALKAAVCALVAFGILLMRPLRWSVRTFLQRRGWVHTSDKTALAKALNNTSAGANGLIQADAPNKPLSC